VPVDEKIIKSAEKNHRAAEPERDVMQFAVHELRILTGLDADVAKHRAPDRRAEQRENGKFQVIHPRDAGGNADQLPRARQQPRDEHAHRVVMRHPALGLLQFFRREKNEFSEAQDERATGHPRQPIHDRRAEPRAERARDDQTDLRRQAGEMKTEKIDAVAGPREMRGGRDDDFARQRQEGAFHRHQQHDDRITGGLERGEIPRDERLEKSFEHWMLV